MRIRSGIILALAVLITLALAGSVATSSAQDGQRTVHLSPGCNMVTLTFPFGTDAATVAAAVSPPDALDAVWRLDNVSRTFQAFMPQAPQASDLESVNLLDAVFVCADAAASIAMPETSPDPTGAPITVNLSEGCNAVGLTFADGSAPSEVAGAVTPAEALQSIWRLDNATGTFQAYVSTAPQASDLTSLSFLDAVFLCAGGPATLSLPAVTEPAGGPVQPSPTPGGTGEEAVRYIMEAAVPQIVDLPQGFEALDEVLLTSGEPDMPQGLLYFYAIDYGDPLALFAGPFEAPFFVEFSLGLFDTVKDAKTLMAETMSLTEEEMEAELLSEIGSVPGIEVDRVTVDAIEPLAGVGEQAAFIRARVSARPAGSNDVTWPIAMDVFTLRRDRVVGEVLLMWTPGPPGPEFVAQNLAKKMDAGIQQALPHLLAAVP